MNLNFINDVIALYELGDLKKDPIKMDGGITNQVYTIETSKGKYILKILFNAETDKIEFAEKIAELAKENDILSLGAIKRNDKYVNTVDQKKFLLYPFYDGKILKSKDITVEQVGFLARELAKLHSIKVLNIKDKIEMYSKIDFTKYYQMIKEFNEEEYNLFKDKIDELVGIYEQVYDAYINLSSQVSYIHRDYNRKNILWKSSNEFAIIDWETATVGNPSIDFFKSSWFMTDDVKDDKFITFKNEYLKIMHLEDDYKKGALAGIIEECNWLDFSFKRALNIGDNYSQDEIILGKEAIKSSLTEIINYYNNIDKMLDLLKK